eukprot:TRINITY_DN4071_c0_g3_i11.p1 TRINITY_DN4071_c0_g3~~TRINITY_DN4071_c0_g3_i11.p1  ORF type:complete len:163 (-),score=58.18 TRINITY_DN4071_c0_g3_i11:261-710(-)
MGDRVESHSKLNLVLELYTSESTPKLLMTNTGGNKILKGQVERELVSGAAKFDKVQIREVSSHFRNGWFFLVVRPKPSKYSSSMHLAGSARAPEGGVTISYEEVKPLVVDRIVVKAKKNKEMLPSAEKPPAGKDEEEDDKVFIEGDTQK